MKKRTVFLGLLMCLIVFTGCRPVTENSISKLKEIDIRVDLNLVTGPEVTGLYERTVRTFSDLDTDALAVQLGGNTDYTTETMPNGNKYYVFEDGRVSFYSKTDGNTGWRSFSYARNDFDVMEWSKFVFEVVNVTGENVRLGEMGIKLADPATEDPVMQSALENSKAIMTATGFAETDYRLKLASRYAPDTLAEIYRLLRTPAGDGQPPVPPTTDTYFVCYELTNFATDKKESDCYALFRYDQKGLIICNVNAGVSYTVSEHACQTPSVQQAYQNAVDLLNVDRAMLTHVYYNAEGTIREPVQGVWQFEFMYDITEEYRKEYGDEYVNEILADGVPGIYKTQLIRIKTLNGELLHRSGGSVVYPNRYAFPDLFEAETQKGDTP